MVDEPGMSHPSASGKHHVPPRFLHVFNYTLKPGPAAKAAFTADVGKIAAAAARTKWPYYWDTLTIEGGGEGAPDYQLAVGGRNWTATAGEPDPPLWKMVANTYGEVQARAIRKSLDDSIAKMSDHFDRYDIELSYIAGK